MDSSHCATQRAERIHIKLLSTHLCMQRGYMCTYMHAHTHILRGWWTQAIVCRNRLSPLTLSISLSPSVHLSPPLSLSLCSISGIDEINLSDFQQVWHCARELKSFQYVDFRLKPITVLHGAWPPPPAGEGRLGCAWWDRDVCKTGYSLVLCMFSDFSPLQPKGIKTIALCQIA